MRKRCRVQRSKIQNVKYKVFKVKCQERETTIFFQNERFEAAKVCIDDRITSLHRVK